MNGGKIRPSSYIQIKKVVMQFRKVKKSCKQREGLPSGAPYPYRKENETLELNLSWLSQLAVLLVGVYAGW